MAYITSTNPVQSFDGLAYSTFTSHAQALAAFGNGTDKFALPTESLGILADRWNENNPILAYSQDLRPSMAGAGSITLEYNNYNNAWVEKENFGDYVKIADFGGNGTERLFNQVKLEREVILWDKPQITKEGLTVYDLKRGLVNVLPERMMGYLKIYQQAAIKDAFRIFLTGDIVQTATGHAISVDSGTKVVGVKTAPAAGATPVEIAEGLYIDIVEAATKVQENAQLKAGEIVISVSSSTFNKLALAGHVGDRVTQTFAGGRFSVGIIGGYKIQSWETFVPSNFEVGLASGTAAIKTIATAKTEIEAGTAKTSFFDLTAAAATDTYAKPLALIGTSDSFVFATDIIAANVGPVNNSSDIEFFLESARIAAIPKRTKILGLAGILIDEIKEKP